MSIIMKNDIVLKIEKQLVSEDYDMVYLLSLLEDAANEIRKLRGQEELPTEFS